MDFSQNVLQSQSFERLHVLNFCETHVNSNLQYILLYTIQAKLNNHHDEMNWVLDIFHNAIIPITQRAVKVAAVTRWHNKKRKLIEGERAQKNKLKGANSGNWWRMAHWASTPLWKRCRFQGACQYMHTPMPRLLPGMPWMSTVDQSVKIT